jgi:hypothetical protein
LNAGLNVGDSGGSFNAVVETDATSGKTRSVFSIPVAACGSGSGLRAAWFHGHGIGDSWALAGASLEDAK